MNRFNRRICIAPLLVFVVASAVHAAANTASQGRRAKPPTFSEKEKAVFFTDPREKLIGRRKPDGGVQTPMPAGNNDSASEAPVAIAGGAFAWSKIISPDVIEDEIKSIQRQMSKTVTTPAGFKGGG